MSPRRQLVSLMDVEFIANKLRNELSKDCALAPGNLPEVRQDVVKPSESSVASHPVERFQPKWYLPGTQPMMKLLTKVCATAVLAPQRGLPRLPSTATRLGRDCLIKLRQD